jgi:diguanylate cyclase
MSAWSVVVTVLPWLLAAAALAAAWVFRRRLQRQSAAAPDLADTEIDAEAGAVEHGLLPRVAFEAALDAAAQRCDDERRSLCVLFVDIDGFTAVNDAHGHDIGDRVLRKLAERLHRATPDKRAATRAGGDEFLLLLEADLAAAQDLARRIQAALAEPLVQGGGRPLQFAASIGIATYPRHGSRARLVAQAHSALRSVKQAGGGAWAVFEPRMAADQREQAALIADLRNAIARHQFQLVYQPKVDAHTLEVTAAEALLRWQHPERGAVSPAVFVPLAERHGLIDEIGNWVVDEACRQAGTWRAAGLRMRVAINLSAHQMRQPDLVPRLLGALAANRLQPDRFTVEITESLALEDAPVTQRTFAALRAAGLHVSIDDFGAGQTSLAYLRRLPAEELKMDRSLVDDLATSADARAIAEAVIRLAHALERRVVAEGVETTAQRDWLQRMGCDELQGHLFARPMSATALGLWALDDDRTARPGFRASLFQDTIASPG